MINVYLNRRLTLTFEYELKGLSSNVISARISIDIEDVTFCFPAIVSQNQIVTSIPALNRITSFELAEGATFKIYLEIIGGGYYLVPWQDTITIKRPVQIKGVQLNKETPIIQLNRV